MTHPLKRTALILMASGATVVLASSAAAEGLRPNFPIRLRPAQAQPAPAPAAEDAPTVTAPEAVKPALRLTPISVSSAPLPPVPAARPVQVDEWPEAQLIKIAARRKAPAHHAAPKADEEPEAQTYTVKKGDTLDKIADRLGTSVAELKRINGLKSSKIQPGQKLKGPGAAPKKASSSSSARKASAPAAETYTVKRGDTLFSIAKKHGVTVDELKAANGLGRKGTIHAGQKLKLAAAVEEETEAPAPRRSERVSSEESGSTVTSRSAVGHVVDVVGPPKTYKVKKGDTLSEVADKLGVSVAELKKLNKIKGTTIRRGQVLKGGSTRAKAYVAAPGDTLGDVARRFSVSPEALRAANGLKRNAALRAGQHLRLPAGYRDRGAITTTTRVPEAERPPVRTAPPETEPTPALPSRPQPYTGTPSTPRPYTPRPIPSTPPAAPTAAPSLSDSQISTLGRGRFVWPVRGDLLSSFGAKPGGTRNDGVNIRGASGDPVRAAAAGDVVYAGDQVPGFGNLVLIKHADGWVTAYGHLSRVDVKMQQKVAQGQQVGLVGATGGVAEPQLHFEIRYGPPGERARPIDPNLVLPR